MKKIPGLHSFFQQLPDDIYKEIQGVMSTRHLDEDEVLCSQGDIQKEMYQVVKGSLKLCNYSYDGKEVVFIKVRPGDCCGEMPLIDGLPRATYAVALEPTEVKVLSEVNFKMLYHKYPIISHQLNVMLCGRVRVLSDLIADSNLLSLRQRMARQIHRLAFSHGAIAGEHDVRVIDTSHEELGTMLGASRQSVSKELKALELDGTIELRYGKIYIRDLEKLEETYEMLMGSEQITPTYTND